MIYVVPLSCVTLHKRVRRRFNRKVRITSLLSQTEVMGLQGRSVHLEGRCRSACGQDAH